MIVAELALETERHGKVSKEVKMRRSTEFRQTQLLRSCRSHQYSGKFFAIRENKNQNHQNSNLHYLYIAEILTKLRAIYDATVWKGIVARFKISDQPTARWCGRSIHDAITQQSRAIYDATVMRSTTTRFRNGMASMYIQEAKERDAISDRRDRFQNQTATIYIQEGKKREVTGDGSIHDAITQQPQSIYDATRWRSRRK